MSSPQMLAAKGARPHAAAKVEPLPGPKAEAGPSPGAAGKRSKENMKPRKSLMVSLDEESLADEIGDASQSEFNRQRIRMRYLFEDPNSSPQAYMLAVVILILIIMSSVTFCLETVHYIQNSESAMDAISFLDKVFIGIFTAEYVLRLFASEHPVHFVLDFQNIIDLTAILPWYIEQILAASGGQSGNVDLRFLRLARVFRVAKLSRYGNRMQMVVQALVESKEILIMLGINLMIVIVVASSIIYMLEKDHSADLSSIPATFWWTVVTILTVGYGDMSPTTTWGKVAASLLMLLSLLVLALPITIIGSSFSNQWDQWKKEQDRTKRMRKLPKVLQTIQPVLEKMLEEVKRHTENVQDQAAQAEKAIQAVRDTVMSSNPRAQEVAVVELRQAVIDLDELAGISLHASAPDVEDLFDSIARLQQDNTRLCAEASGLVQEGVRELRQMMKQKIQKRDDFQLAGVNLKYYAGFLIVEVIGAQNLEATRSLVKGTDEIPDPAFVFRCGSSSFQTAACPSSCNPMYDETHVLLVRSPADGMEVECQDGDAVLGSTEVKLDDVQVGGPRVTRWYDLDVGDSRGRVKFAYQMRSFEGIDESVMTDMNLWQSFCTSLLPDDDDAESEAAEGGGRAATAGAVPIPGAAGGAAKHLAADGGPDV